MHDFFSSELPRRDGTADSGPTTVAVAVRVGQLITFALAQGVILITAVLIYLSLGGGGAERGDGELEPVAEQTAGSVSSDFLFPLIGLSVAAVCCVAAVLVPGFIRQQAIAKFHASGGSLPMPLQADTELPLPARELVQGRMAATLVSQATLEGAAVLNAILLLISPQLLFLLPVAVAVFGIVVQVPTAGKVLDWLQWVNRT